MISERGFTKIVEVIVIGKDKSYSQSNHDCSRMVSVVCCGPPSVTVLSNVSCQPYNLWHVRFHKLWGWRFG